MGPTSKRREGKGEGRGREDKGGGEEKGGEGKGKMGGNCPPLSEILNTPLADGMCVVLQISEKFCPKAI